METIQCVLYARVSTTDQAEKQLSIPAQLEAMRQYAATQGWRVVREFLEPGVSARTAERPSLQALLAMVRDDEARVGVVLVHKIDRLARNVYDHANIRAALGQRGIRLVSCTENLDDSISGQLVENIMASIAQFYSANLSEEVKKGMKQKVLQGGWPHRPPRGYVVVESATGNRIELHPTDAPLMARAFELYGTGWWSLKQTASALFADGLRGETGQPISHAHLRRLLSNSFYAGRVRWQNTEARGNHPPLVSQELFEKVQDVLRTRSQNPGPRGSVIRGFSLRGIAMCAKCAGRMTGERHGKWRYYRCSRQTYKRSLCEARYCNVDRVETDLQRICRGVHIDGGLAEQIVRAATSIINERRSRSLDSPEKRARQDSILEQELSEAFVAGAISSARFGKEVEELRSQRLTESTERRTQDRSAQEIAMAVANFLRIAQSLWDIYSSVADCRRATLLRIVFSKVVVDHKGIAGFVLRPPFDTLAKVTEPTAIARSLVEAA